MLCCYNIVIIVLLLFYCFIIRYMETAVQHLDRSSNIVKEIALGRNIQPLGMIIIIFSVFYFNTFILFCL